MTLGEKLNDARKNAGMTQEQLASVLSVSRQAITKWESDRQNRTLTVFLLAKFIFPT